MELSQSLPQLLQIERQIPQVAAAARKHLPTPLKLILSLLLNNHMHKFLFLHLHNKFKPAFKMLEITELNKFTTDKAVIQLT